MSFQKLFRPGLVIGIGFVSTIFFLIFGISILNSSINIVRAMEHYKAEVVKVEKYSSSSRSSGGNPCYTMQFYHNGELRKIGMKVESRHIGPKITDSIEGIWYNPITEKYLYRKLKEKEFSLSPYIPTFIVALILTIPFLYAITGVFYWIWKRKLRLTYKNGLMKIESFAERE